MTLKALLCFVYKLICLCIIKTLVQKKKYCVTCRFCEMVHLNFVLVLQKFLVGTSDATNGKVGLEPYEISMQRL